MHRDIKPENLIVESEDADIINFKMVDFGLAAPIIETNRLFKKCGTPGFVAPEIFSTNDGKYN